ncbi:histidine phosphatase superfamily [Phyllosticta citrichinensis]|uniref:Histidine phosphatase superfamily n=1 Tax=Phyllosticta citrichinensis TaxID=1130410 RepID=A0ABR1Y161_9PEZI
MIRLFLIRHGETVDNVAQVYAGRRDSDLTNHGFHQGTRLGQWLANRNVKFTHIFSSTLKRAHKTAQLIADAQKPSDPSTTEVTKVEVTPLDLLQEQDYGSYEGQPFSVRRFSDRQDLRESHPTPGSDNSSFVDVESKDSMAQRADEFISDYLVSLCASAEADEEIVAAVVAHGIILSVLWKRFLQRLDRNSVSLVQVLQGPKAPVSLEHLGAFSNTGFLELDMSKNPKPTRLLETTTKHTAVDPIQNDALLPTEGSFPAGKDDEVPAKEPHNSDCSESKNATSQEIAGAPPSYPMLHSWTTEIRAINCKDHLNGLKRTGRGVGSARHDETQKTMDSFFKRQKRE